jgi:DNA-binding transcriptional LysR family regulator
MTLLAVQLESFLAVAAASNVSRAARQLHLTQPAVTKHVRALEQKLGVRLMERTARGIRLTSAGDMVRNYGRQSAALLDECQRALGDLTAGVTGTLTIGAGVTTSSYQLPRWLGVYRRQWPAVDIRIHTAESRAVAELVRAREVDCGFVTTDLSQPDLSARKLYSEIIVLVVSADATYPARVELSRVPLITFPARTGFRRFLEHAWAVAGVEAHVHMEIDSMEATKSLVAVGLGGAFLPAAAVREELEAGRLRQLAVRGLPTLRRQTTLLRRHDPRPSRALMSFLDLLNRPA